MSFSTENCILLFIERLHHRQRRSARQTPPVRRCVLLHRMTAPFSSLSVFTTGNDAPHAKLHPFDVMSFSTENCILLFIERLHYRQRRSARQTPPVRRYVLLHRMTAPFSSLNVFTTGNDAPHAKLHPFDVMSFSTENCILLFIERLHYRQRRSARQTPPVRRYVLLHRKTAPFSSLSVFTTATTLRTPNSTRST